MTQRELAEDVAQSELTAEQRKMLATLEAGGAIRDLVGLTAEQVEAAYLIGVRLAGHAKFEKAEPMLQFACLNDHREPRYWMALGKCRQSLKNYTGAIDAYILAHWLDEQDLQPFVETAVCCLALGDKDNAREVLAQADRAILAKPDEAARQRISAMRQAL